MSPRDGTSVLRQSDDGNHIAKDRCMTQTRVTVAQRCQLVRFTCKPYEFLRFAQAYRCMMQSLWMFMIFTKQIVRDLHELFLNGAEYYST